MQTFLFQTNFSIMKGTGNVNNNQEYTKYSNDKNTQSIKSNDCTEKYFYCVDLCSILEFSYFLTKIWLCLHFVYKSKEEVWNELGCGRRGVDQELKKSYNYFYLFSNTPCHYTLYVLHDINNAFTLLLAQHTASIFLL